MSDEKKKEEASRSFIDTDILQQVACIKDELQKMNYMINSYICGKMAKKKYALIFCFKNEIKQVAKSSDSESLREIIRFAVKSNNHDKKYYEIIEI
jgi:hypothetical protein